MSGHSKWATIKRQKGVKDEKRGQLFTKLAREITVAARSGVADPEANFRLRLAVQKARSENMPRDNIERAIERATAAGGSDSLEEISYEGFGPGGVAIVVQAMTDNRNRTVGEVRSTLTRAGGTLGESGSVGWMFDHVGLITINPGETDLDDLALMAIDAGAVDVVTDDGFEIYTEVQDLHTVQEALVAAGLEVESADLFLRPTTIMAPELDVSVKVLRLLEKLDDLDDVQQVYSNLDVTDDVMAAAS